MTRVIMYSGKGGVGKTTLAAATAVAAADRGFRTLVMSFDLAHSLSDAFRLDRTLFDVNAGLPQRVAENLDVQEISVQDELQRHWSDIYDYMALMLTSTGLSGVVAEEVAIMPGTEDVIALMYLNRYVKTGSYDVIVVDCPPTGDTLRFLNLTSVLEWYIRRRFNVDRTLVRVAGPLAARFTNYDIPSDDYFKTMKKLFDYVDGVDKILGNTEMTSIRLVCSAERMVVRETQRAYMYFNMYGVTTDQIVVNRMIPPTAGALSKWHETQTAYVEQIEEFFAPVPVYRVPMQEDEVSGIEALRGVGEIVYADADPTTNTIGAPSYTFTKGEGHYRVDVRMPFVTHDEIELDRTEHSLVVRVGTFKRHVPLPRALLSLEATDACLANNQLSIRFE